MARRVAVLSALVLVVINDESLLRRDLRALGADALYSGNHVATGPQAPRHLPGRPRRA